MKIIRHNEAVLSENIQINKCDVKQLSINSRFPQNQHANT